MKTAEEMKKQISLFVEYKDHDRVILSNANGDAFSSKSEDLIDFLHGIKDSQASELPSDDEIESLSVKRYRGEDLDEQKRNSKLILAFEDGLKQMRSIASPLLASRDARILELEEALKDSQVFIKLFREKVGDNAYFGGVSLDKALDTNWNLIKSITPPKP